MRSAKRFLIRFRWMWALGLAGVAVGIFMVSCAAEESASRPGVDAGLAAQQEAEENFVIQLE